MRAVVLALLVPSVAAAQPADLGHRLPGGVGLDAGSQPAQGLYVATRFVWFASNRVNDRDGARVPIEGLDIDAYANVLGVAGALKLGPVYVSAAVAVPFAKLSLSADLPQASVDRLGLGDVFAQPLQLGARFAHADVVASYAFYAPTRQTARTGVGRPQWSHQASAGGTYFFDDVRGWRISALASYVHNDNKLDIDITRGASFQIQGGAGGRVFDRVIAGVAGYALWQITDDTGADLPEQLRGARERVFGIGPEVDVAIPQIRAQLAARFEWDLGAEARPAGTIFVIGLSVAAWR
jgi:hypothetical protein